MLLSRYGKFTILKLKSSSSSCMYVCMCDACTGDKTGMRKEERGREGKRGEERGSFVKRV